MIETRRRAHESANTRMALGGIAVRVGYLLPITRNYARHMRQGELTNARGKGRLGYFRGS